MNVVVVDHGLCNVGSVRRALEECGARVHVSDDPRSLTDDVTHVVLPGVGSFRAGMDQLHRLEWVTPLRAIAASGNATVLGICLGMQLLADSGTEGGETEGLGLIPGRVTRIVPREGERVPHVGWNDVQVAQPSPLFDGVPRDTDFYFVHSYQFVTESPSHRIASVDYCGTIAAAVGRGRVFGVQFHPEKSSKAGFQLLRNYLAI